MVKRLGYRAGIALGVLFLYWLILFVGMHVPEDVVPPSPSLSDKTAHFVAYAGLALVLAWAISTQAISLLVARAAIVTGLTVPLAWAARLRRCKAWPDYLILWTMLVGYAAADEVTQPLTGRTCELADWVADAAGIALGLGGFLVVSAVFKRRSRTAGSDSETPLP